MVPGFLSMLKKGGLAVNPINQSTATKGNLEGILGLFFYWGDRGLTANFRTFCSSISFRICPLTRSFSGGGLAINPYQQALSG
jgi:hypothetical protein